MCGIAGRILAEYGDVGKDLVTLMEAQKHRGADSTGFAIYGVPRDTGYVIRAMGFDRKTFAKDVAEFRKILQEHGSDFIEDPTYNEDGKTKHYLLRAIISAPKAIDAWIAEADTMLERIEVQSVGRSLEIIKDVGSAQDVSDAHNVASMQGTHGLGHARLATESDVRPNASHPFWARPFPDVAIVHNGQITDYNTWRKKLEYKGYRFLTSNDSELLAVWVSDLMKQGKSMQEALSQSILQIDGVFTYMIAQPHSIGFAKDKFAMKPLVVINRNHEIVVATEEQAVRRIYREESDVINYDGPSLSKIWTVGNKDIAA